MAYYETYMPNELGEMQKVVINAGVGFVLPYYGETAPPGTLACDGSEVSREAYKELFQVLGTKAGAGDGSTTFNLPDLRGKWMMGADAERAAGDEIAEGLPNIGGKINIRYPAIANTEGAFTYKLVQSTSVDNLLVDNTGNVQFQQMTFLSSNSNSIYGASQHVTPASVALLWCIIYE